MKKKKYKSTEMLEAFELNELTYLDYLERFKKIAISIFEWVNLPSSMEQHYIEECLYYKGQCAFLFDENYGFINTNCASAGFVNIYGLPTKLNCYSYEYNSNRITYNGLKNIEKAKEKSAILVMNNFDRIPTVDTIQLFAQRLTECDRTCDVNIKAQKTPYFILCDQKEKFSMVNLFNQVINNEVKIFGNKQLANTPPQVLDLNAPYVADKIMLYKRQIWNEALTFLGVNNIIEEKKERLVEDEANSNNELINLNLQSYLTPRKEACKQFNELFDLKGENQIDVRVRSDLKNIIKNAMSVVNDFKDYEEIENIDIKGE